jgi:hypothetical protein
MLITMTVLAAFVALALAMSAGYSWGRRAGSAPVTWKTRTSRLSLGKQTVDLLLSVAARRVRRRLRANPVVKVVALRTLASLGRGGVSRMRSYRAAAGW